MNRPLPALERWDEIEARLGRSEVVVFLDYDGTLTPIVDRPDEARLGEEMREALRRLADVFPTVVMSGRGREDVEERVGVSGLWYAGSHGFDITGPNGIRHEEAPEARDMVRRASARLGDALRGVDGAIVENKRYSVSVHFRLVAASEVSTVERAVDDALADEPGLRKAYGKKVFELRPRVDWDKGKALLWILGALGRGRDRTVPLYVGDDLTDEDAFEVIQEWGIGIRVGDPEPPTAASEWLRDPSEVCELLRRLARRSG